MDTERFLLVVLGLIIEKKYFFSKQENVAFFYLTCLMLFIKQLLPLIYCYNLYYPIFGRLHVLGFFDQPCDGLE